MGKRPISRRYDQITVAAFLPWRSSKGADCIGLAQELKIRLLQNNSQVLFELFTRHYVNTIPVYFWRILFHHFTSIDK